MALNFGLLGDAGAPAMGYLQGQQDVTRNQLAQQQVETGRMTQDKMRMEMDAMNRRQAGLDKFMARAKELGVNGDPEELTKAFWEHAISTGDPEQIQAATIAVQTARERKAYMGGQPSAAAPGAVSMPVSTSNNLGAPLPPAGAPPMPYAPAPAVAAAPTQNNALAGNRLTQIENRLIELRQFPTAGKQERDDLIKERDRLMTPHVVGDSLVTLGGGVNYTAPAKSKQTDLQLNYQAAKDQGFTGSIFDYERKLKEAGRAPATPATPAAPVAVVGADGKVKYVSREEAISKGMTPASAMESLAPKEIQNREAKYPAAKRVTATVSATMTEIENTIDRLLDNENGLNGITGFVGGRTFAVTDAARRAEADLKQLKNLAFVQGLTELRNASSTGAGVGNVSNKEGDRFENLKASLEQTQSKDDLVASLKRLKSQSTATRDTVNQAFEDTYAYRANAPAAPAPKPSGGGTPPPPPRFKLD